MRMRMKRITFMGITLLFMLAFISDVKAGRGQGHASSYTSVSTGDDATSLHDVLLPGQQEASSSPSSSSCGIDASSLSVGSLQVIPSSLRVGDWVSAKDWIIMGPKYSAFERPLPRLVDDEFLVAASDELNKEQLIFTHCGTNGKGGECSNTFTPEGQPFIVRLDDAFVTWHGLVFDRKYVYPATREAGTHDVWVPYRNSTGFQKDLLEQAQDVVCFDKVITILQPYEDNYYHFVAEALPRLLLAREMLLGDDEMLLLTRFSRSFIPQFLEILGIPLSRVINANVLEKQKTYLHAKQLFVPTPMKIFAVPKEALWSVRRAVDQMLNDEAVSQGERNLVVYVTRRNTWSRRIVNEEALVDAIGHFVQTTKSTLGLELVVFDSSEHSVGSAIRTFGRARLIIGAHGAGFANMLFSREGTPVFEFLHSFSPLLCYWHMASALGMPYWMLPVTQSHWGGDLSIAPSEITAYLHHIFQPSGGAQVPCQAGWTGSILGTRQTCEQCPVGTFSWGSECVACAAGRYADTPGSSFCSTCGPNTFSSANGDKCIPCPEGTRSHFWGTFLESCQPIDDGKPSGPIIQGIMIPYLVPLATYQFNVTDMAYKHDHAWYGFLSADNVRLLVSSLLLIGLVVCYIVFRNEPTAATTHSDVLPYTAVPNS